LWRSHGIWFLRKRNNCGGFGVCRRFVLPEPENARKRYRREWVGGCNPMHGDGEKELVG